MLIIGNQGCVNCAKTKKLLTAKGITYTYVQYEELSSDEQTKYKDAAKKAGLMSFPIIINDNDEVITLAEALTSTSITVVKRNGTSVSFDKNRIINAVNLATNETSDLDENLSLSIANAVTDKLRNRGLVMESYY